jgi:hypothetical protein
MVSVRPATGSLATIVAEAIVALAFITYMILGDFWSLSVLTLGLFVLSGLIARDREAPDDH